MLCENVQKASNTETRETGLWDEGVTWEMIQDGKEARAEHIGAGH